MSAPAWAVEMLAWRCKAAAMADGTQESDMIGWGLFWTFHQAFL